MTAPSVVLIGVDGATWGLLEAWAEAGQLPAFRSLMDRGVRARLRSVVPPVTAPAWTSMMTGKNPGKHGVFNLISMDRTQCSVRYMSGADRRARTLWGLLSEAGRRVCVVNMPMTYPAEAVNGCLISGTDAPSINEKAVYPPGLRREIRRAVGEVRLDIRYIGNMHDLRRRRAVLKELAEIEGQRLGLVQHLIERYPCDLLAVVFSITDKVQHYFWHYLDPTHHLYDEEGAREFSSSILRSYQVVDDKIGRLLSKLPERTVVVVMSDHGFGPTGPWKLSLNRYLAQLGLLRFRESSGKDRLRERIQGRMTRLDRSLRRVVGHRQKAFLARLFPGILGRVDSYVSLSGIDHGRTLAYSFENSASSAEIWIEPHLSAPDRERTLALVREGLSSLADPATGQPLGIRVHRRENLYQGPLLEQAPEFVLEWWADPGVTLEQSRPGESDRPVLRRFTRADATGLEWTGTHRLDGIFLAAGGPCQKGIRVDGVSILDIAPTLLYLSGAPVPEDMDGRVVLEALDPGFCRDHPLLTQAAEEGSAEPAEPVAVYSEAEAAEVAERLRGLGYME